MTKQEEITVLDELVNASSIYKSIAALDMMLKMYKSSPQVKNHRYTVMSEVLKVREKLKELQFVLDYSIENSKEWEKIGLSDG